MLRMMYDVYFALNYFFPLAIWKLPINFIDRTSLFIDFESEREKLRWIY